MRTSVESRRYIIKWEESVRPSHLAFALGSRGTGVDVTRRAAQPGLH